MGTDNQNKIPFTFLQNINCAFVGVRVGVWGLWNKLVLRKNLKNLHAETQRSSFCMYYPRSQHSYGRTDMASSTRLVILSKNI